jgi:hypothetical protein
MIMLVLALVFLEVRDCTVYVYVNTVEMLSDGTLKRQQSRFEFSERNT